ncbi:Sister chromatid cohesion protein DCC1 [[Candida] zeylanoides]
MYSLYARTEFPPDHSYKLIQLPPALLRCVEGAAGGAELVIKAPSADAGHLVLCTADETYQLRQMNHSNTVLLVGANARLEHPHGAPPPPPAAAGEAAAAATALVSLATLSYEYEPTPTSGHIDTEGLPVFDGGELRGRDISVAELRAVSAISARQFDRQWAALCGSEVRGRAVLLAAPLVTELLSLLLTTLIADGVDYRTAAIDAAAWGARVAPQHASATPAVVRTIVAKFGATQLDHGAIAAWYGVEQLRRHTAVRAVADGAFLVAWKASLPAFYNVPLDLALLRGHYCRPAPGTLQHLSAASLSTDVAARVKDLFRVAPEWEYDDFVAFLEGYVPAGKKAESVVMKYARKRKAGRRVVVSPR